MKFRKQIVMVRKLIRSMSVQDIATILKSPPCRRVDRRLSPDRELTVFKAIAAELARDPRKVMAVAVSAGIYNSKGELTKTFGGAGCPDNSAGKTKHR